jgi:hypothetical protein
MTAHLSPIDDLFPALFQPHPISDIARRIQPYSVSRPPHLWGRSLAEVLAEAEEEQRYKADEDTWPST